MRFEELNQPMSLVFLSSERPLWPSLGGGGNALHRAAKTGYALRRQLSFHFRPKGVRMYSDPCVVCA